MEKSAFLLASPPRKRRVLKLRKYKKNLTFLRQVLAGAKEICKERSDGIVFCPTSQFIIYLSAKHVTPVNVCKATFGDFAICFFFSSAFFLSLGKKIRLRRTLTGALFYACLRHRVFLPHILPFPLCGASARICIFSFTQKN